MNRHEFECDTPECRFWDEENGCTKQTSVTIQEHCCCDFEEKPHDKIFIVVSGGAVQCVFTTLEADVRAELIDLDNAAADGDNPDALTNARESIEFIEAHHRQIL